jgi:hypothetical protein
MPLTLQRGRAFSRIPESAYPSIASRAQTIEIHDRACLIPSPGDALALLIAGHRTNTGNEERLWVERSPLWLADLVFLHRRLRQLPALPRALAPELPGFLELADRLGA